MGTPSDRRFLRAAKRQLGHLFPCLPSQDALHKRRARLAETIEWLIGVFAARSPGHGDDLLLLDSTPVECGRSLETTRRSRLADICGYGYSRSHSRYFWGMRLHLACAPDGTPRAAALVGADRPEREVALQILAPALRGGETIVCDKGYAGREFAAKMAALGASVVRPARRDEPKVGLHLAPIRQRIESVFCTCKDLPLARAPRCPHTAQPVRADRDPAARARGLHQPQPPARPSQPRARRLHRIAAWHQSSSPRGVPSRSADRISLPRADWGTRTVAAESPLGSTVVRSRRRVVTTGTKAPPSRRYRGDLRRLTPSLARRTLGRAPVASAHDDAAVSGQRTVSTKSASEDEATTERSAPTGRLFRVFVSSTFADLEKERNALREVFRGLAEMCDRRGAHFLAVDLRWGVSEEAALGQQAVEICLEEIVRCQERTPRPNFVLLLGERYGWRPLPARIPASELEALRAHLEPDRAKLVERWYLKDCNAVPAEYVLQPRTDTYEDATVWEEVERSMREALAAAAETVGLDATAQRRYRTSVTEQEARAGVLDVDGVQAQVHCFFRTIAGLPESDSGRVFRDEGESRDRLVRLKDEVRRLLGEERVHEYETRWAKDAPAEDYLAALCGDVGEALSTAIDAELAHDKIVDALDREREEHLRFGRDRSRSFVGRAAQLRALADYVAGELGSPLAVVGASGVGKTAFMARAADAARAGSDAFVVERFVGATSRAAVARTLVRDLLTELRRARGGPETDIPGAYLDLVDAFRDELVHERTQRVALFVDGLDQLSTHGEEVDLRWLPSELPPGARIVVSAAEGAVSESLQRRPFAIVEIEPMPRAEAGDLLDAWLAGASRKLQHRQRDEVLRSFAATGLPLHLRLAFEEARRWHSYDPAEETVLADSVPGVIRDLFARLSAKEHGKLLVSRSLAYLAAARNGVSEAEMLALLSADTDVFDEFRERSPHSPAVDRIPDIIWSRLRSDLEPYLNERRMDGRILLGFFHRQLADVVDEDLLAGKDGRDRHGELAAYFGRQPLAWGGGDGTSPNLRKLSELPFQQTHAGDWDGLFATLTDFAFLEQKVIAYEPDVRVEADGRLTRTYPGVLLLEEDFERALRHWPRADP